MNRDTVQDLVCGMRFLREDARAATVWEGVTYYFCCGGCRGTFEADPGRYTRPREEQKDER